MEAASAAPAGQNTASAPDAEPEVIVFEPPRTFPQPAFAVNNIPVFLGCDNNFLPHAATTIASIMAHASPENNYDLFIVHDGIPMERMVMATRWLRQYPNASLRFVDIRGMVANRDFPMPSVGSLATYFRLFAPDIFAAFAKITYLDSDVVVLADVADFHNTDLTGMTLAACHDFVVEWQSRTDSRLADYWRSELGKEAGEPYFNAGCLVMNLERIRELDLNSALLEKVRAIKNLSMFDQDVLNAVLNGSVRYLGCEWNYLDWARNPDEEEPAFGMITNEALAQLRQRRNECKILHYTERKPWTLNYRGISDHLYWSYAKQTPFLPETLQKLGVGKSKAVLLLKIAALTVQQGNFALRRFFSSPEKRDKHSQYLVKLKIKKMNLLRYMRLGRGEMPMEEKNEKNGRIHRCAVFIP